MYLLIILPEHNMPITFPLVHLLPISYITSDVPNKSINAQVSMMVMTVSTIVRHGFYAPCFMFCVSLSPTLPVLQELIDSITHQVFLIYHTLSDPITRCNVMTIVLSWFVTHVKFLPVL